jgi:hypothetical protein
MGLAYLGIGFGSVAAPWVSVLVRKYGWQTPLRVLGASIILITLPFALIVKEPPAGIQTRARDTSADVRRALKTLPCALLVIGSMGSIAAVSRTQQNLKLFLSLDRRYAQADAAHSHPPAHSTNNRAGCFSCGPTVSPLTSFPPSSNVALSDCTKNTHLRFMPLNRAICRAMHQHETVIRITRQLAHGELVRIFGSVDRQVPENRHQRLRGPLLKAGEKSVLRGHSQREIRTIIAAAGRLSWFVAKPARSGRRYSNASSSRQKSTRDLLGKKTL